MWLDCDKQCELGNGHFGRQLYGQRSSDLFGDRQQQQPRSRRNYVDRRKDFYCETEATLKIELCFASIRSGLGLARWNCCFDSYFNESFNLLELEHVSLVGGTVIESKLRPWRHIRLQRADAVDAHLEPPENKLLQDALVRRTCEACSYRHQINKPRSRTGDPRHGRTKSR